MKKFVRALMILSLFCAVGCNNYKDSLINKGIGLVSKIEKFRTENGYLPDSLEVLGIRETLNGSLFYDKVDSVNYMVWFGTFLGESMIYYSDTKDWDYRLRGMGEDR